MGMKCSGNSAWAANKWCQQSWWNAGKGYNGDNCSIPTGAPGYTFAMKYHASRALSLLDLRRSYGTGARSEMALVHCAALGVDDANNEIQYEAKLRLCTKVAALAAHRAPH